MSMSPIPPKMEREPVRFLLTYISTAAMFLLAVLLLMVRLAWVGAHLPVPESPPPDTLQECIRRCIP